MGSPLQFDQVAYLPGKCRILAMSFRRASPPSALNREPESIGIKSLDPGFRRGDDLSVMFAPYDDPPVG